MSFQLVYSHRTEHKINLKQQIRKEEDSTRTHPIIYENPEKEERTSLFTSLKGAITAEASMVLPLFLLAVCCLCYLLEIMAIQLNVHSAAHSVGREIAKEAYAVPLVIPSKVEADIVKIIGTEKIERSIIKNGSSGIDCSKTRISSGTGILHMNVEYEIVLPISLFGTLSLPCKEEFQMKGWTGYVKNGFSGNREEVVYITDTGIVYHRDYHCTYLELSIHMVGKSEINNMRNDYQEKYYPCEKCGNRAGEQVYITNQGNRYHSSLGCSGLKRIVYAVPISEVMGKGVCSRCGY